MAVDLVCGIMKCGSEGKKDLDLNWSVNTVNTVNMTTRTPVSTLALLTRSPETYCFDKEDRQESKVFLFLCPHLCHNRLGRVYRCPWPVETESHRQ